MSYNIYNYASAFKLRCAPFTSFLILTPYPCPVKSSPPHETKISHKVWAMSNQIRPDSIAILDFQISPSAEFASTDENDAFDAKTESLCWPSCHSCGKCLNPEIPPCFCPYCAAFNTS